MEIIENFFEDTTTYPVEVLPFFDGDIEFDDLTDPQCLPYANTISRIPLEGLDDLQTDPAIPCPVPHVRCVIACPACDERQENTRWCRSCGTDIDDRLRNP
jgi:hypothetical protein